MQRQTLESADGIFYTLRSNEKKGTAGQSLFNFRFLVEKYSLKKGYYKQAGICLVHEGLLIQSHTLYMHLLDPVT